MELHELCERYELGLGWTEEEIKHFIENKGNRLLKLTKEGHRIYRKYEDGGAGAFRIGSNDHGLSQYGHLDRDKGVRGKQIQSLMSLRGEYQVKITEILNNGSIREH